MGMCRCGGDRGIKNWLLLCKAARSRCNTVAVQHSRRAMQHSRRAIKYGGFSRHSGLDPESRVPRSWAGAGFNWPGATRRNSVRPENAGGRHSVR